MTDNVNGYILFTNCVFIIINMVFRPEFCLEINFAGLTGCSHIEVYYGEKSIP